MIRLSGASVVTIALGGCGLLHTKASYRFRMTVEVETPQGLKTGSGVLQMNGVVNTKLTAEERSGGAGLQGQAVIVDLPDGPVFVLLSNVANRELFPVAVTTALAPVPDTEKDWNAGFMASVQRLARARPGEFKADLHYEPMMVRFRNINDPKSVELVDPNAISVKRIWVETTDAPLTTGIEKRLRWLHHYRDWLEVGNKLLSNGDFTTEIGK